ncbi:LVIVD repeat-containing protein [Flavobacteriaceae bacterium MAR_2010_72]|nr:LVIVD repeat-containing protein [Flavobacteriaceae bacterium MAR_2010_72]TVZ57674.1 LVIVD repeat-containing protein [Flavobacteriaceae bacterium MAR_2010_105]
MLIWSCSKDNSDFEIIDVAIPEVITKADFRSQIVPQSPKPITEAGKIYAYNNLIFISDKLLGIHVLDNSNPSNPSPLTFLKVPGNEDMAVKDGFLYADSFIDLVVFDISNTSDIKRVEILEDVFDNYNFQFPFDFWSTRIDMEDFDSNNEIIVGWTVEKRIVPKEDGSLVYQTFENSLGNSGGGNSGDGGNIGAGGSLARFQIVENYLYTVGWHEMSIFNIANLSQPSFITTNYAGNNIETLFEADGYLYIGSTDGMYIYGLENPESPNYISEFVHWTGCDPVVVDGNYAYLTIRGGNNCGNQQSVLEVIDVSNKATPTLVATYSLDNPYGLGFKNDNLFVCDGSSGLKVYKKNDPLNLQLAQKFENIQATDVIPLNNTLVMVGDNVIYQYEYSNDVLTLLSTYNF